MSSPDPIPFARSTAVASPMKVRKRNGTFEPVDVNKIVRAVGRCCEGLTQVVVASSFTLAGKGDLEAVSFTSLAWRSSRTLWLKPVPTCPM